MENEVHCEAREEEKRRVLLNETVRGGAAGVDFGTLSQGREMREELGKKRPVYQRREARSVQGSNKLA